MSASMMSMHREQAHKPHHPHDQAAHAEADREFIAECLTGRFGHTALDIAAEATTHVESMPEPQADDYPRVADLMLDIAARRDREAGETEDTAVALLTDGDFLRDEDGVVREILEVDHTTAAESAVLLTGVNMWRYLRSSGTVPSVAV